MIEENKPDAGKLVEAGLGGRDSENG